MNLHNLFDITVPRALGRAPVSCLHRSPRLGAGLTWRLPGPADFQLILMRVRLGLGLAAGRRRPPAPASSFQEVLTLKKLFCF